METKQKRTKVTVSVLVLAGLLVFSLLAIASSLEPIALSDWAVYSSSGAPTSMYVKFEGLDGEAEDKDHKGWSDILSFSQGQSLPDGGTGPTRRRGDVVFEDIVVAKELDKASPKLAEAVCQGRVFPKVEIHLTASYADAGRVTYYAYEFRNVLIASYYISGSGQGEDVPTEEISFSFEEIKATYTETDETGKAKGNVEYQWSVVETSTIR
jgi:type VI secretion system secreted protein Hcp